MIRAVVPMKALGAAKQRLAPACPPDLRRALAVAMLRDVLETLAAAPGLDGIVVASPDPDVAAIAAAYGARFEGDAGGGLTAAVTAAGRRLAMGGTVAMLVVPGDVPATTPDEITAVLGAYRDGHDFVIVPAHDGRGTNGILVAPPDAVPFAYGEDSFAAHLAAARRSGLSPRVLPLPGLGLDVDHPGDLPRLAALPGAAGTRRLLAAHGLLAPTTAA